MILVGQMDSPFLRRVAVTMNHYGLPFERKSLSVFTDQTALRAINPLGKVPALVLDEGETGGEVLFDSQMILDYLDETAGPDVSLTPPAGEDRRKVLRIATVALGVAEKVVALNIETRIRAEGTTDPRLVRHFEGQVKSALQWLEAEAPKPDQEPWFLGPDMTQADVTAACALTHAHEKRPELFSPETTPALAALRMRAEALDIFKASPFEEG